jgi:hypothetical protein
MADPIATALANLGNYRVRRVQEVALEGAPDGISGFLLLALGYRETSLRNINGGATWDPVAKKWVAAKRDRGWLQINQDYHADWLKSVPGCPEGTWVPEPGHSAFEVGYCPRFTDALRFTVDEFHEALAFAEDNGVPKEDRVRFAIAAHNAGLGGARKGYREGNVDKYTALGIYSYAILETRPQIQSWITKHPKWYVNPS